MHISHEYISKLANRVSSLLVQQNQWDVCTMRRPRILFLHTDVNSNSIQQLSDHAPSVACGQ